MGLQLSRAEEVTDSDIECACLFYPIGRLTPDSREQVEDIPTRGEWQLGNLAEQLSLRRENIERMSTGLTRAIKHKLADRCIECDVQVESQDRFVVA